MFLTVIVPIRDEEKHIAGVLDQILGQEILEPLEQFEIIVVDGMSSDKSADIVHGYCQKFSNVRYFQNPKRLSSAARNIGITQAKGDAVIVVDGHCIISHKTMLSNVAKAFETSGADCLGRPQPQEMTDATPLQWAIAAARRSPMGHHADSFIYSAQPQFVPASSVAVAYRKNVFDKVGCFDENFDACEDVELNTRCDKAGLKCWFTQDIAVSYVPRNSLGGLFRQLARYGTGRTRLYRKHPDTFSFSSFLPAIFVACVFAGLLMVLATLLIPHLPSAVCFLSVFYISVLGVYFTLLIGESFRLTVRGQIPAGTKLRVFFLIPFTFIAIHFGCGCGTIRTLLMDAE